MKFSDKYPDAEYLQEVEPSIVKFRDGEPCWICGQKTVFIEINFQAAICSEECLGTIDKEYWEMSAK
jgi:hypothetical protein